ncbi:GFA family protein [Porticoccus sp. W117]|uniref:GFA family protein n=1 Tax=Porticoccus sp. W117 TaxID=3054777 RepID=UPI0025915B8B|nr:GFA family protein [Porticoccus sp. W117]MDM3872482.1 GFA family protein [Porticoccus sp. W117]
MYQGECHCGAVSFEISEAPEKLVDCNCSICRRIGALWGHVSIDSVNINSPAEGTTAYVQGDKTLAVHTCKSCGCTTHWESLQADGEYMAVNFRMCEPEVIEQFRIRKFDGADSWKFLD